MFLSLQWSLERMSRLEECSDALLVSRQNMVIWRERGEREKGKRGGEREERETQR